MLNRLTPRRWLVYLLVSPTSIKRQYPAKRFPPQLALAILSLIQITGDCHPDYLFISSPRALRLPQNMKKDVTITENYERIPSRPAISGSPRDGRHAASGRHKNI